MTLIFRLIIRRDIWIFHSKVFSSGPLDYREGVHHVKLDPANGCKHHYFVNKLFLKIDPIRKWTY